MSNTSEWKELVTRQTAATATAMRLTLSLDCMLQTENNPNSGTFLSNLLNV